jgi:chromosome segregation ATPase
VLYLAEVQKQKGGLLGGGSKAELKLLACQRNDQSWSSVSDEVITAEEANKLNDGVIVMVEMSPQRQVQRIQEAGRPLVNILQNYSRQVEKFKAKEEEIDQWKESLTFQAQELSRRELEMEDRMAQLQQLEEECQNLDKEKQEVDSARVEFERLKEELERNRQELEGAWQHLRGEQRRLEEHQTEFQQNHQQGAVLDEERSRVINELLERICANIPATETVVENLDFTFEVVKSQQELLNSHWQKFEQLKTQVEELQAELDNLLQDLVLTQEESQQVQATLDQQTAQLKDTTSTLGTKLEYARILREQLRYQENLYQQIYNLIATSAETITNEQVEIEALESMSLEELEKKVIELQDKLSIDSTFVNDQEQELIYKQEAIDELEQKISQAASSDKAAIGEELADEKDLHQMLNQTLVGQRRNLQQRQEELNQYQAVLLRRQGKTLFAEEKDNAINLKPILEQIESQCDQQSQELQNIEREIEEIQSSIDASEGTINNQTHDVEEKRQELHIKEENLRSRQSALAESKGLLEFYTEALAPIQDSVNSLQEKLKTVSETLSQVQQTGDSQHQAVDEMRQTLRSLRE